LKQEAALEIRMLKEKYEKEIDQLKRQAMNDKQGLAKEL
jgi:hypothetical protein